MNYASPLKRSLTLRSFRFFFFFFVVDSTRKYPVEKCFNLNAFVHQHEKSFSINVLREKQIKKLVPPLLTLALDKIRNRRKFRKRKTIEIIRRSMGPMVRLWHYEYVHIQRQYCNIFGATCYSHKCTISYPNQKQ